MNTLGKKIKRLRKDQDLTLDQLSKLSSCSKSYLWEIEKKDVKLSGEKVFSISKALGVTVDYLLDDAGEIDVIDSVDEAFYKKYLSFDEKTKEKIRKIVDCLS